MGTKKNGLELYLHIPFCIKKCDYCDFLSGPATRAGQEAYIYALLREMKAVSAIEKRTVDTVFIGGGTPSVPECGIMEKLLQGIRLGRIGTFEDVASAIAYLGSDDASWTTGEVLDVNGGLQY